MMFKIWKLDAAKNEWIEVMATPIMAWALEAADRWTDWSDGEDVFGVSDRETGEWI